MKTFRFTDSQIIALLKLAEAGSPVPELCREHGMSTATFYKWSAKFGGMESNRRFSMHASSSWVVTFAALGLGSAVRAGTVVGTAPYALRQEWSLGEAGRWDYADVDPMRHRRFLTRGDRVQVLDLPSGAVRGEIPGTQGVQEWPSRRTSA